ncbi:hypothetical protein ABID65_007560 [Bradyrhizobium sp. S3.9.2]|uniref:hypothetical protein n=1 Tax=Bradyrhizobium sp. S3.9.2 TaxID=3156432 RepID=UPI003393E1B1
MQPFVVSICAGVFFPLTPLLLEFILLDHVKLDSVAITAVVYVTAIGLVSRHQAILISCFLVSLVCAVIYAGYALELDKNEHHTNFKRYGLIITVGAIGAFSVCYIMERYTRHCIEKTPFLEL